MLVGKWTTGQNKGEWVWTMIAEGNYREDCWLARMFE